jgi:8-oxo-dGTP pyrophosphatase MutT (NUDIX family)
MIEATLCFILDGNPPTRVLLGKKKRGFGCGKHNGLGGKVRPNETPVGTIVREVEEEAGVIVSPDTLRSAGSVTFRFPSNPAFDHHVHVFVTNAWEGKVRESAEMAPAWFPIAKIPYNLMWDDDRYWLPFVLSGKRIRAEFSFAEDNETVAAWAIEGS